MMEITRVKKMLLPYIVAFNALNTNVFQCLSRLPGCSLTFLRGAKVSAL